jgi:hypothetical protein
MAWTSDPEHNPQPEYPTWVRIRVYRGWRGLRDIRECFLYLEHEHVCFLWIINLDIYMNEYTCMHIFMYTYQYTYIYLYIYVYIYIHTYIHTYIYKYIYIHVHIYIYTNIHLYIYLPVDSDVLLVLDKADVGFKISVSLLSSCTSFADLSTLLVLIIS